MTRDRPLLGVVAGFTVVATVLLLAVPSHLGTVGQVGLGVPLVLLVPGYVVLRIIFGGRDHATLIDGDDARFGTGTRSGLVTLGLSIGVSVALVPILVRVVMATVGYSRGAVVLSLGVFVTLGAVVAAYRSGERLTVSPRDARAAYRTSRARVTHYFGRETKFGMATSVVLVVCVVFFLSTVGFALSDAPTGEPDTEFYLLTENESGDLVASGYPTTLGDGPTELVAGIENHEHEDTTYTVVVEIQDRRDGSTVRETELVRAQRTVAAGDRETIRHTIDPEMGGEDLRLQYYLYRGTAPTDPGTDDAYRTLSLTVTSPAGR